MRKIFLIFAIALFSLNLAAKGEQVVLVDMDYIMSAIPAYETANEQLDQISKKWQKEVEAILIEVQTMYKNYQTELVFLSDEMKKKREDEIKEIQQQIDDLYKEAEKRHKEYVESLEKDASAIETSINYAVDILDEEIEKLQQEKNALDEANDSLKEQIELQELEDALAKAKQKKIRVYRKGQGFVYEQDTKAISEAQSAIDEYKSELAHKKEVSMIDEKIRKLQELRDAWKNIPETYKKAQAEIIVLQRMGSDAQQKILSGDLEFIQNFADAYTQVQDDLKAAHAMSVEDMVQFYEDIADQVDLLNAKLASIQAITIKVSSTTTKSFNTIIDKIDTINTKLTSELSTTAVANFSKTFGRYIDNLIGKLRELQQLENETGISHNELDGDDDYNNGGGGSPSIGDIVTLKQPNSYYYGDQEFEVVGTSWDGKIQLHWTGSDEDGVTYAVDVSEISGYASGTLGTSQKIFKINENGIEALVSPSGTVISAPSTGYGVIKNQYTERLTDFASDPMKFLNKVFSGYSSSYQKNNSNNEIININGNLTLPNVTDGLSFIDSIKNVALQYTTRRR